MTKTAEKMKIEGAQLFVERRIMKKKIDIAVVGLTLLFFTLLLVNSAIARDDNDASKIKTLLKGYESVLNASDVKVILKLYAKDGVFLCRSIALHK